jgi:3-deoxy-manno-octulosonate cytidylyltransferase (CMP-KDO synthetase)
MSKIIYAGIIPARYASTRFPGKPLADIGGRSMIRRVYDQASRTIENVYVATDDERIFNAVRDFGGEAVMTSSAHRSGTDRCREAVQIIEQKTGLNFDVVINIQGDEPFIQPAQLELIKDCFKNSQVQIATLIKPVRTIAELTDPNRPKVIVGSHGEALYFSRSPIPYVRGEDPAQWLKVHTFYTHIGLYGYRKEVLYEISGLDRSSLEIAESLEQLRWLQNGYTIYTALTDYESFGIDTPEDLEEAIKRLAGKGE